MTCEHCGAALPPVAVFCGRCGRSVSGPPVPPAAIVPPAVVPPVVAPPAVAPPAVAPPEIIAPAETEGDPRPPVRDGAAATPTASLAPCASCGTRPEAGDRFCGECGEPIAARPAPADPAPADPAPAPEPQPIGFGLLDATSEPASPAPEPAAPPPIVLQFSTGESVSVIGSGLLGRNPRPEPGEVVDHVVIVTDPTRSVSKTHLEFGRDGDAFWVSDRHSGNGTVLREPGQLPRYCEPGRRYPVSRGTRVDMGDQFMIIA